MRAGGRSQRGWIGLVVVLLALVIVALLAQSALKRYGVAGAPAAMPVPQAAGGTAPASIERAQTPIERAKAASDAVTRAAEEQRKRVDEAAQ
jgi:hypothetical protein